MIRREARRARPHLDREAPVAQESGTRHNQGAPRGENENQRLACVKGFIQHTKYIIFVGLFISICRLILDAASATNLYDQLPSVFNTTSADAMTQFAAHFGKRSLGWLLLVPPWFFATGGTQPPGVYSSCMTGVFVVGLIPEAVYHVCTGLNAIITWCENKSKRRDDRPSGIVLRQHSGYL